MSPESSRNFSSNRKTKGLKPLLWLFIAILGYIICSVFFSTKPFATSHYDFVPLKQFEKLLRTTSSSAGLRHYGVVINATTPLCPPIPESSFQSRQTLGRLQSLFTLSSPSAGESFDEKAFSQRFQTEVGGSWSPKTCKSVHRTVVIVPFRERSSQLKKFLIYMHQFLQLQLISYKIYVVEQTDDLPFNRGKLFNIGFNISVRNDPSLECFIFHDVDLLPESVLNVYGCTQKPRHMSAVTNTFRYTLLYPTLFGGAIALAKEMFQRVNGFSNNYFGWGGEDDDFYLRLKSVGVDIIRLSPSIASYRMLPHKKQLVNSAEQQDLVTAYTKEKRRHDGLNTLSYTVVNHISGPLYTLIQVRL